MVQFYKSYIQPCIDYCNAIWGGTTQGNPNRIYRLKRACKIPLDHQYETISDSILEELNILNIYERIYLKKSQVHVQNFQITHTHSM